MHPFRPGSAGPVRLGRRLAVVALTVAALTLGGLVQPAVDTGVTVPSTGRGTTATATTGGADLVPVAAGRVELKRRQGRITGDGATVYLANRTEFRPRATTVDLPPRVRADAWVVVDLDTGRVLGKHRARARLPQASTMKLLTAVTATRTLRRGTRHRVTRFEAGQVCSCAGLRRGGPYDRDTLLAGMLLPSGNDAAEAVAGSHPRGRKAFYRAMNRVATRLGATDTEARNASGLTAAGSHSSARDLVLLLRAAVADPTVRGILEAPSARVATVDGRFARTVWRSTDYVNQVPGSLGKGGWTTPAQNTLSVVTEVGGGRIAVASLGAPSGYSTDGARALTQWAATNLTGLAAVGRLPRP
jgi:D-alanyl-D-alanine carboxypeptidase (penicillin-binding protein 5/6)